MSNSNWSATESRILEPFARADGFLEGIGFRFEPTTPFSSDRVTWFDRGAVPEPLKPEFSLVFDSDGLGAAVGIPADDLSASVVVRDRAVKQWDMVARWPLHEVPERFSIEVPPYTYAIGVRMEFGFLVTPSTRLPYREGRARLPTQVVAASAFELNTRKDGTRFNVASVKPEWFDQNGMPRDTVWAIDWESRDPTKEPIAALTVVVNEEYEERLQKALEPSTTSDLISIQMAVDIFVEVALTTLRNASEFETEPGTLLGSVLAGLGVTKQEDFDTLVERVNDDADRASIVSLIRGRVQSRLGLGKALK